MHLSCPRLKVLLLMLVLVSLPVHTVQWWTVARNTQRREPTLEFNSLGTVYRVNYTMEERPAKVVELTPEQGKVVEVEGPATNKTRGEALAEKISELLGIGNEKMEDLLESGKCKVKNKTEEDPLRQILAKPWTNINKKQVSNTWKSEAPVEVGSNLIITYVNDRLSVEEFVATGKEATTEEAMPDKFVLECNTEDTLNPQDPEDRLVMKLLLGEVQNSTQGEVRDLGDVEKTVVSKQRTVTVEMNDVLWDED